MISARRTRTESCLPLRTSCCSLRPSSCVNRRALTGSANPPPHSQRPISPPLRVSLGRQLPADVHRCVADPANVRGQRTSGGTSPYTWTATGLPNGMTVTSGGVLSGTPTIAGAARVTVTVTDSAGRTSNVSFTVTVKAPVAVTNPGEQSSTVGIATQLALAATGGDGTYTWKADGLPAGLALDTATGVISGTPTAAATGTVKITATDPSGTAGIFNLSWTVVAPASLTNPGTVQGTLGIEVSQQLAVTGGKAPYAWKADGLPAGLSLAPGTGLISGTPSRGTSANVTVTVTDALKNTSTMTFSFIVVAPALTLSTPTPGTTDQGQAIPALSITVAESAGPLTWTADGLPDGLAIDRTTGVITGTARTAGTFTVTIAAVSDNGRAGSTSFPWKIYAGPSTGSAMDSGTVAGLGADVSSGGVAVLGGYAYTFVGYRVVRYSVAGGKSAVAETVAGSDGYGCVDAGSGGQARFYGNARVIGTDGSLIYVVDFSCGVRAVNPVGGATRSINAPFSAGSTIAGHFLYTSDTYGRISRYDLQSGQATRVFEGVEIYGVLAADNSYLWGLNNNDLKLYRLSLDGSAPVKTFPLPAGGITTARSAGDYVYYTDNRNLLSRISKTDGSLQVVAGDGAHDDDLLYNTTGIATDGTYLNTAGEHGLAKLTNTPRVYEEPASRAAVNFGDVRPVGADVTSGGVAVIGGYAYTFVGYKVVRYQVAKGKNAAAEPVAGSDGYGCVDAGSGSGARFYGNARVIGTDGSLLYVVDFSCGVRAVNPNSGATRTVPAPFSAGSTIAGHLLYTSDTYGRIWRYDLQSGQNTRMFDGVVDMYGVLAADNTYLWGLNNNDNKLYQLPLDGSTVVKTFPLPAGGITTARSAGEYIYYTDNRNLLNRISKTGGTLQIVAGEGAHDDNLLYNTTAIATDGTYLYTAGEHGLAKLASVPRTFAAPASALSTNVCRVGDTPVHVRR
ncbi:putative Ig domain-containing protein [Actinoplanes sp. HUAS TT8]|uniref:putative Ig domain-containing protein n=1 Tax=Actinoplanes sp. HUAS TT8 TaxID=3447453 RepID=UPI003F51F1A7